MLVFEIALTNRDKLISNHSHSRLIKLSNSSSVRKAISLFGSIPWKHRLIRVNFSISRFIHFLRLVIPLKKYLSRYFFLNPSYCFFSPLLLLFLFIFSRMTTLSFETKKGRPRVVKEHLLNSYFQSSTYQLVFREKPILFPSNSMDYIYILNYKPKKSPTTQKKLPVF